MPARIHSREAIVAAAGRFLAGHTLYEIEADTGVSWGSLYHALQQVTDIDVKRTRRDWRRRQLRGRRRT